MALDSLKLSELLEEVASGALQLPDFQRQWKWDDERIRALVATITLDYPLGVVMALEVGEVSPFRARPLRGAEGSEGAKPGMLLLDGQQRLTSLFQALFKEGAVETFDSRNKPLKRRYYIDIAKAIGPPADRDEAIVSVPEDGMLKTNSHPKLLLDLTTTERECEAGYFPLHLVFDTRRVNAWQRAFAKDDARWEVWSKFEDQVLAKMRSFQVPMIKLKASTTMDAVCAVFERVNTGGVPLNVFELLTATYAGNQDYSAEHLGAYYQLPEEWRRIKKELTTSHPVFGRPDADPGAEDGLSSSDFLQAVALVLTWELKQSGQVAAVSCKRRDLLELPLADFRRLAPRVQEAFAWVGSFLEQQCIVRTADLPYRTQLVPLAAVRAITGAETDLPANEDRISRWYWCGVLGEMYGGSIESRFTRDVEQLIAWIRGNEGVVPDTIAESAFLAERLDTLTTRNSAAYKGIYAQLIKQGAVDWYFTDAPFNPSRLVEHSVDVRQIFPKNWFSRNSVARPSRMNSIVNKTPLSLRASRSISGTPGMYVKSLALESGMRPEWFDDVIATHLIDASTLHEADFEKFYENRARQLLDLVMSAMGKRTVFRDTSGW
ncbi:GmrSD restriction endonuclease domain-containing protein [Streptomyces xiamenensis]|uniref:GmrSD restriction endonuclease domain-containing protein n=1 Tax=Streptomyces xiamenensis TaxID=408015 RepID=UPI0037D4C1CD